MLTPSAGTKIFLAKGPLDMRKSHNGLIGATRDILKQDPLSGHFFVFFNRRRNRIKILVWETGGFWLFYKKLERGTIGIPNYLHSATKYAVIEKWQLDILFAGISVKEIERRKRYTGYGHQTQQVDCRRSPTPIPQR